MVVRLGESRLSPGIIKAGFDEKPAFSIFTVLSRVDDEVVKRICVYCGSGVGHLDGYADAARAMGRAMADAQMALVYGGGNIGMMGELAKSVLDAGGEVTGVIPQALFDRNLALASVTDMRIVRTMHERKALMADLADAFVAMPGGWGTLEEFFEIVTWAQLKLHCKPCGLLNVHGYFDHLIRFVDYAVEQRFIDRVHRDLFCVEADPRSLLCRLRENAPGGASYDAGHQSKVP